jgi:hypothetical protein
LIEATQWMTRTFSLHLLVLFLRTYEIMYVLT